MQSGSRGDDEDFPLMLRSLSSEEDVPHSEEKEKIGFTQGYKKKKAKSDTAYGEPPSATPFLARCIAPYN